MSSQKLHNPVINVLNSSWETKEPYGVKSVSRFETRPWVYTRMKTPSQHEKNK
jgi:hypothetical protein